jgi:hypothetical protein
MWRRWDRRVVDIRFAGIICLLCGWPRWLDGERSSGELGRRESGQLDSTSRAEKRSNGWYSVHPASSSSFPSRMPQAVKPRDMISSEVNTWFAGHPKFTLVQLIHLYRYSIQYERILAHL